MCYQLMGAGNSPGSAEIDRRGARLSLQTAHQRLRRRLGCRPHVVIDCFAVLDGFGRPVQHCGRGLSRRWKIGLRCSIDPKGTVRHLMA